MFLRNSVDRRATYNSTFRSLFKPSEQKKEALWLHSELLRLPEIGTVTYNTQ